MLKKIFRSWKIEYFSAVPASLLKPANVRLYEALPKGDLKAIFYLMPYYVEGTDSALSKYAAVYDYHGFSRQLSAEIVDYIGNNYPDAYCAAYADHSPFAEVDGASRAGLGSVGKNGLLINGKHSSFVFIGEILCDLTKEELRNEGVPLTDGEPTPCCGCGACLRSCPALCEDFSNCVSALTQKKGELTADEISAITKSGYLWGCDGCQLCCPVTKRQIENGEIITPIKYFREGAIRDNAAEKIEAMTDVEFAKYPFSWRKKETILRNVRIIGEREK